MRPRLLIGLAALLAVALPAAIEGAVGVGNGGGTPGTAQNFRLVGHNPLFNRGLNAAPAVFEGGGGPFVYVGNRTDGTSTCGIGDPRRGTGVPCPHPNPGILVVNAHDAKNPKVVNEIGPPFAGNPNETARELRVWEREKLLIVLNFRCSPVIHACAGGAVTPTYRFFDLHNPRKPRHILTFVPTQTAGNTIRVPHEFYLWQDPEDKKRALLWESDPTTSNDPNRPNLIIRDISAVPDGGEPFTVAEGNWNHLYEGGGAPPAAFDFDLAVHSMAPSFDGTRTHLAYLRGHYLVLDTTKVAKDQVPPGTVESLNDDLLTHPADRPRWGTGNVCPGHTPAGCGESHSAVPIFGKDVAFVIDEVYGTFTVPSFGWPWGWARLIDFSDPAHPVIVGEYKIFQNTEAFRPFVDPATEAFTSYSSHNPTVTDELVFDAWHSGGLQAIDVDDPTQPGQAGWFSPTPLSSVANEDPALSRGPNRVVIWSYPIVVDGLIFVVDIRNGLYILRYTGEGEDEVEDIDFLEGNSNLGDAEELDEGDDDDEDEEGEDDDD